MGSPLCARYFLLAAEQTDSTAALNAFTYVK
jgi:hypothetical protein